MATLERGIKLSDFGAASPEEREKLTNKLFEEALNPTQEQLNRQMDEIDARIRAFERQYEMPSASMHQKVLERKMQETADICSWLMLLKVRQRFDKHRH